ncbi:MAG: bifunctional DNA-formamidopyrimidine glycosylase/DNA-(apurinic or apyrimidinic site) lyase [Frankia sp.]|nr:bifunctional DNA-formamidopyrimidine glycosylase/DNA-(apurinic or apyrimidinic site) lyase [Frankia sp.]
MPELPEVEVVRRGLERGVVGRTIAAVTVYHPRAVRRHPAGAADFAAVLTGQTILAARRRGKYLWLDLAPAEQPLALIGHLGMSGQLLVVPPSSPDQTHLRIRFRFSDGGRELRFVDQRTFGGMSVAPAGPQVPVPLAHIARDPLDPRFDDDAFVAALRARRTGIKRALLDQRLVSGIGNIYADEALWAAGLHYDRPADSLRPADARRLLAEVRTVLTAALAAGGTSFDRLYVSTEGVSGLFERELAVYGLAGQPCRRCGTPIRRDPFMNRSSFTCPRCQRPPRRPRAGVG